jgi:hypothetical protein
VTPSDAPITTYEIAADGSVFKWWNIIKGGPEVSLAGTLWVDQEKEIPVGLHNLEVQAHAWEGVSSIQIITNGDTVVEEQTCDQNPETPEVDCINQIDEWVVETGSLQPGIMQIEVIATDRIGNVTTKRFWVNVPYTPPPDPEAPHKPTFAEIKAFRQAYGLDLDLNPVTEVQQINNRVYDLLAAWGNPQTPEGEVARRSSERWGIPLRSKDVAELEYREWYVASTVPSIDQWAYNSFPNTYAGYEVDEAHGGIIRIGFTESQSQRVAEFIKDAGPVAPDRVNTFLVTPARPLASAEVLEEKVVDAVDADPQLQSAVTRIGLKTGANLVEVGTNNTATTEGRLTQLLGSLQGLEVLHEDQSFELLMSRDREGGRMLAGDRVWTDWQPNSPKPEFTWGTAGFGAFEKTWIPAEKRYETTRFLLAAGHMGKTGNFMYRIDHIPSLKELDSRENKEKLGRIGRNPYWEGSRTVDALAMRFRSDGLAPVSIFGEGPSRPLMGPEAKAFNGEKVCFSGARTEGVRCGEVLGFERNYGEGHFHMGLIKVRAYREGARPHGGDSGGPVWDPRTGASIGLVSSDSKKYPLLYYVQPLLTTASRNHGPIVGALDASVMGSGSLHIIQGDK